MNTSLKQAPVGKDRIREGQRLLGLYRTGRASIERRITEDEKFWNSRHECTPISSSSDMPSPASAWMFSVIVNKHADMLENIPTPICLAREESDEQAADTLNSVLPVIYDRLSFTQVYSDAMYDKLKHGTAVYGVFWDPCAENGIGDIEVKRVDLLNLYWEPGIREIQDSSNIFYVSLMDREALLEKYPQAADSNAAGSTSFGFLSNNESGKSVIIDWYYKKKVGTKNVLHYIKFTGDTLLYASENDPESELGFYAHGMYPFVFDVLYRESDSPCGYGLISITKGTQNYIDRLDENIIERSIMASKPRYMIKKNVGLDKDEFLDWNNPIIEVDGDLTEERLKAITLPSLDESVITVRDSKINEMREIASNKTVNYGETSGNITSGVAIAALQEAGNKVSRDIISGSWNAFISVTRLVIELIREFYTEERCFRITRPNEEAYSYITFSGRDIGEKKLDLGGMTLYRLPIFDIEVRAGKSSAFSRLAQNETVINLYKLGLFKPENAREAVTVLDALELEGKSRILDNIKENLASANESGTSRTEAEGSSRGIGACKKLSQGFHSASKLNEGGDHI